MYNNDENAYRSEREQQLDTFVKAGHYAQALELLHAWSEREPWNGEVLVRMAVVHWLAGEPARTLRDLDAFLAMHPDNAEVLSRRAQALLMLGKRVDAEDTLNRAEAIDPNTPGVFLNRALLLEEDGDYSEAIHRLTSYLAVVPNDHLALARRSHLYRQLGDYPHALEDAQACVAMRSDDPESHFAEALAHVTLEQGTEALAACDRCLTLKASFLPALRLKVDLLADLGFHVQAETALAALESFEPHAPHTALLRARLAAERGEYAVALEWIGSYLDDYPDEPYGYYRRGMIYYQMANYSTALEDFQQYARLAPRALEAYEQQFLCHLALEQYPQAAAVGKLAIELQPQSYRLHYNLAFAELLCGRQPQAKMGFHTALDLAVENEELVMRIHQALTEHASAAERLEWFGAAVARHGAESIMLKGLYADVLLDSGQPEDALRLAHEVLDEDFQRPFAYLLGIKALCLLNRYDEALAMADAGVETLPQDARLRLGRALVLRDSDRPDEALRDLDTAWRLLPGDPEVLVQQGLTYASMGRLGNAVKLLRQAVQLDPQNVDTCFWLGFFQLHRRRWREALATAERLLALMPDAAAGILIRGAALRGLRRHAGADADFERVREEAPALLARLSADPIIAELLNPPVPEGPFERVRRTITEGWQQVRQIMHSSG